MTLADALATVPTMLASAFGAPAVEWRARVGEGAWTTLTGAHVGPARLVQDFDDERRREIDAVEVRLVVPSTSQAMVPGYEIRVASDDDQTYAVKVIEQDATHGAAVYACRSRDTRRFTTNRKGR